MASGPITSWEIDGETVETVADFIFLGSKITADGDCSHDIKRHLLLGRTVMTHLDSILKSRDITLSIWSKLWFFQWSYMDVRVGLWGKLNAKNWCFWTVVLEKTLTSPWLQGDPSWVFTGRTDAEAETPILWPPHAKSWLIWKDPDAGRDWGQEEKGMTEDEMAGWHHRLDGHEFEYIPGVCDGQGGLACCNSWGRKELDTAERLNWTSSSKINRTKA